LLKIDCRTLETFLYGQDKIARRNAETDVENCSAAAITAFARQESYRFRFCCAIIKNLLYDSVPNLKV
jgi:hypothetical protein